MKRNYRQLLYAALMGMLLMIQQACGNKEVHEEKVNKQCITDTLIKHIKLDTVGSEMIQSELKLTGAITFNEDKMAKVFPLVGGIAEDVKVELGDYVQKGQVLAVIRSSEVLDYQNQLTAAESNLSIAEKNVDVAEDMFKSGLTSEKDLVTARKELQKAKADVLRNKEVLKIFGVGNKPYYSIKAPVSGFVVEKNIVESMEFRSDNTSNLFTISDLENVWVMANVYETDISKLKLHDQVNIATISYPDKVFTGTIDKISSIIDPDTKVLKVRIVLPNKDFLLKPDMFVNVNVKHSTSDIKMLTVPSEAVIFDNNKNYVLVYDGPCKIEKREINPIENENGKTYVDGGLKEGERVISKYQLLVYASLTDR